MWPFIMEVLLIMEIQTSHEQFAYWELEVSFSLEEQQNWELKDVLRWKRNKLRLSTWVIISPNSSDTIRKRAQQFSVQGHDGFNTNQ